MSSVLSYVVLRGFEFKILTLPTHKYGYIGHIPMSIVNTYRQSGGEEAFLFAMPLNTQPIAKNDKEIEEARQ